MCPWGAVVQALGGRCVAHGSNRSDLATQDLGEKSRSAKSDAEVGHGTQATPLGWRHPVKAPSGQARVELGERCRQSEPCIFKLNRGRIGDIPIDFTPFVRKVCLAVRVPLNFGDCLRTEFNLIAGSRQDACVAGILVLKAIDGHEFGDSLRIRVALSVCPTGRDNPAPQWWSAAAPAFVGEVRKSPRQVDVSTHAAIRRRRVRSRYRLAGVPGEGQEAVREIGLKVAAVGQVGFGIGLGTISVSWSSCLKTFVKPASAHMVSCRPAFIVVSRLGCSSAMRSAGISSADRDRASCASNRTLARSRPPATRRMRPSSTVLPTPRKPLGPNFRADEPARMRASAMAVPSIRRRGPPVQVGALRYRAQGLSTARYLAV